MHYRVSSHCEHFEAEHPKGYQIKTAPKRYDEHPRPFTWEFPPGRSTYHVRCSRKYMRGYFSMLVCLQIFFLRVILLWAPSEASVRASRMRLFFQNIPRDATEGPPPQPTKKQIIISPTLLDTPSQMNTYCANRDRKVSMVIEIQITAHSFNTLNSL